MRRTVFQRKAKERQRRWRKANPEKFRAQSARYRELHPRTPEQVARNIEMNRLWRLKNAARLKRERKEKWAARSAKANAARRAKYALDKGLAERNRARAAAWRAANSNHNRDFYYRRREKFTGNGPWSSRTKRFKRAWRKFTKTCAASRAITNGATQC